MIKTLRRKTLPALPPKAPAELRPLFAAMMEILETGEGVRGNKLDRKLTLRDLLDGGIAKLKVPGNPESGITQPAGPQNMSVPPRPAGFSADGSFFGMVHLSWDTPQNLYNNHAVTNIYRGEVDDFAKAQVIGREPGMFYSDKVRDDIEAVEDPLNLPGFYYWITFTTTSNVEGPPSSAGGAFAKPLLDAAYLLGQLSGKLGESELDGALSGRIDKIDGPATMPGSVAERISAESAARIQALKDQNTSISANIEEERDARIAAIAGGLDSAKGYTDAKITLEQTARSDSFEALTLQIEQIEAGLGEDYTVGMAIEKQARISGDVALGSRIDTMTAYAEGVAADLVNERQVRATKDSALASDITALYVESGDLKSSVSNESQARINGDAILSSVQQVISAANAVGSAAIKVSSEVFITENEAMASKTESLRVSTGASVSDINNSLQVLTNASTAQAGRIDNLQVETENSTSQIRSDLTALAESDTAQTQAIDSMSSEINEAKAAILLERETTVSENSALSSDISTAQSAVNGIVVSVQEITQTVIDVDERVSAQNTIQLDVNGYVSGHGSYNDGATADFAVLADRFWVAQPGKPNSATKPFMVVNGVNYLDTAVIRDGSIESGKLGPITFGKIFDAAGNPITTLGGKLRADMIDVDTLTVGDANISGIIKSTATDDQGRPSWQLDKDGGFQMNSSSAGGRMEIQENLFRMWYPNGRLLLRMGSW